MNDIEKYAIDVIEDGAANCAQDDLDEEGVFESEDDWRTARKLAIGMANAIRTNPESFLAWYRSVEQPEVRA